MFDKIHEDLKDTVVVKDLSRNLDRRETEISKGLQNFCMEYLYLVSQVQEHHKSQQLEKFAKIRENASVPKPAAEIQYDPDHIKLLQYFLLCETQDPTLCGDFIQ